MNISKLPKNQMVKVIFSEHDQRFPMIGKFVDLHDSKELERKGMVRFINQSKLDFYVPGETAVALSRIYLASDFTQVIPV